jgi:hypothetical protein
MSSGSGNNGISWKKFKIDVKFLEIYFPGEDE